MRCPHCGSLLQPSTSLGKLTQLSNRSVHALAVKLSGRPRCNPSIQPERQTLALLYSTQEQVNVSLRCIVPQSFSITWLVLATQHSLVHEPSSEPQAW
jgi:hypothetical protein